MTPIAQVDPNLVFRGASANKVTAGAQALAPVADPLGRLADLPGPGGQPGTRVRQGFNAIWRPEDLAANGTDRFLELNLTAERGSSKGFSTGLGFADLRRATRGGSNLFGGCFRKI